MVLILALSIKKELLRGGIKELDAVSNTLTHKCNYFRPKVMTLPGIPLLVSEGLVVSMPVPSHALWE